MDIEELLDIIDNRIIFLKKEKKRNESIKNTISHYLASDKKNYLMEAYFSFIKSRICHSEKYDKSNPLIDLNDLYDYFDLAVKILEKQIRDEEMEKSVLLERVTPGGFFFQAKRTK